MQACSLSATLQQFSAKWKPCILSHLMVKERRYSELLKIIPNVSKKMLTQHLRELEQDGLVIKVVHPSIPPKVTYYLSPKGQSLEKIFETISVWGVNHLDDVTPMEELIQH